MNRVICQTTFLWFVFVGMVVIGQEAGQPPAEDGAQSLESEVASDENVESEPEPVAEFRQADRDQIIAAVQSYVVAFNARDVDKLVSHWSPDGVYRSRTSGDEVTGHEQMKAEFAAAFAAERVPQLACTTESIRFVSPNVALEEGTAIVTHSEDEVVQTQYSVVFIKHQGVWLIDRVSEEEIEEEISNYEQLRPLEWLIGQWIDEDESVTIEMDCAWTASQNFISRKYTVSNDEGVESSGLQIIGWDARQQQIRSWLFDSSGTVVTGTWWQGDDRWTVQSVATLPDGTTGSFTSIFRPTEDGNYRWKKINRILDGRLLPNIDEVVVRRN